MAKAFFISLPVADVARSASFYGAIGFERDAQMSNPQAAAMRWGEAVTINLMSQALFATLLPPRGEGTPGPGGVAFALPMDDRAAVDAVAAAALAAGGREVHGAEDQGFLYSRGFEDPDGHAFGPFHMDQDAFAAMQREQASA